MGSLSRRGGWTITIVATLAMSVSYLDRQVLAVLGRSVREALAISHQQFGWLAGAFSIAYLVGAPLAGVLIDRIGSRKGLAFAVLLWSMVAGLHAFASSFAILFALRIALGAAEAPSFPGAAQAVKRSLEPRDRSAGFGVVFTGSSIGAMIAAPLAVAMKARWGWQVAFIGTAMVGLSWLPLWLAVTGTRAARAAMSPPEEQSQGPAASRRDLMRMPAVLRAIVLVLACAPAIMFCLIWMPQYLQHAFLVPENDIGKYMWVPPVAFDLGAVGFGALASMRHKKQGSQADIIVMGAALCAAIALMPFARGPWTAVILACSCMAGGGGLYARFTADMLARVSPAHTSTAGGITAAAQSIVYVVANPIVGKVVDLTHSYDGVLVTLGVIVIPGALAWIFWPMSAKGDALADAQRP